MNAAVLARPLARLRLQYRNSGLHRFLAWWGGELVASLPAAVREALVERRDVVLVAARPEGIEIERRGRHAVAAELLPASEDLTPAQTRLRAVLGADETQPEVVLCLPAGRALRRQVVLPAAAEENLHQVLGYDMDRQTPFRADQIYFDQRVVARDAAARQITVEFALVPRPVVDEELARVAPLQFGLDAVDLRDVDGDRAGFNLLPAERRAQRRNPWIAINLALGAAVLVLLALVMAKSVSNREAALAALTAETEAVRQEARSVAELRSTLAAAVDGANFLNERKAKVPVVSDLLLDVTRRLDGTTWLLRLSVNGDQVQLQGQSREAASLITVLQQSRLLQGPALQGAITPDPRTNLEQFLIQATAVKPQAAGAAQAGAGSTTEGGRADPAQG
jgi:general secretion pathway protein L